jgi:hypothetical protein
MAECEEMKFEISRCSMTMLSIGNLEYIRNRANRSSN